MSDFDIKMQMINGVPVPFIINKRKESKQVKEEPKKKKGGKKNAL